MLNHFDRRWIVGFVLWSFSGGGCSSNDTPQLIPSNPAHNTSSSLPAAKSTAPTPTNLINTVVTTPTARPLKETNDAAIKALITTYLATPLDQKFKYVVDGEQLRTVMAQYYAQFQKPGAVITTTINSITYISDSAAIADTIAVTNNARKTTDNLLSVYVRKHDNIWLIDWRANSGWNPIRLKVFNATTPSDEFTFRVFAELSASYYGPYSHSQDTHYSIRLKDTSAELAFVQGYANKTTRAGEKLFDILKDGNAHRITVLIQCNDRQSGTVDILDVVSDTWFIDK